MGTKAVPRLNPPCSYAACEKPSKSKGLCEVHRQYEWRSSNPKKYKDQQLRRITRHNSRYSLGKSVAKKRGLSWTLTLEEFSLLLNMPCTYCNDAFGKTRTGTALDRIDNTKGYDLSNVLPCCVTCNRTRGDRFTVEETKAMIEAVLSLRAVEALSEANKKLGW